MESKVKTVTTANFQEEVINAPNPVLVDYWAAWCMPCRMIAPILEDLSKEMDSLTIAKLNVDENPQIAAQFGIMSIPTLILYQGGKEVTRFVGVMPKDKIKQQVEAAIK